MAKLNLERPGMTFIKPIEAINPSRFDLHFRVGDNSTSNLFTSSTFPGGEEHVQLTGFAIEKLKTAKRVAVSAIDGKSSTIIKVALLLDAIGHDSTARATTIFSYTPYARQDRVCSPGEAFSIVVFASIIEILVTDELVFLDVHSEAAKDVILDMTCDQTVYFIEQVDILEAILDNSIDTQLDETLYFCNGLISPDKGAVKKSDAVKFLLEKGYNKHYPLYLAEKTRVDGRVVTTYLEDFVPGLAITDAMIFDDICDGGGTFISLAKYIKGIHPDLNLNLFVTHATFCNPDNLAELRKLYKKIFVVNYIGNNPEVKFNGITLV